MRIAMIGQKGIPTRFGGIERHVEALAVRLGAAGNEVTVYTRAWYAPANPLFAQGVRAVVTPTVNTKHLDAIAHTLTSTIHAMRNGADVIHYHGVGPSLLSWIPRIFAPRIRVVSTFHCIDRFHQKWGWFARTALALGERAACMFPHRTIVVSRTLQHYVRSAFDRDAEYIPNGVSAPERHERDDALAPLGLARGGYLMACSRLVQHKGIHHLIDAFKALKMRGETRGMKLAIVGGSAFTDDYVERLHSMAEGHEDIVFTGYRQDEELDQLFNGSYAVVHPSESEGLPIAVLEAMSYGKTVLGSDIPEIVEVTGAHGLQFKNRDAVDLAFKLRRLINDPTDAAEKGAKAREFVIREYHWDDVAKNVTDVYGRL
jgi:glycosyltransferase involved in cell wall biosynthesis